MIDLFKFKQVQGLLFCKFAFLLMEEVRVLLGLEPGNIEFLFNVIDPNQITLIPITIHLLDVNGLLSHFFQKLFNIEILLLDFLVQVRVVLFENSFLTLQLFQALDVFVDLTCLELDVLFVIDQLLLL